MTERERAETEKALAGLDEALSHGPHYVRAAATGAVIGVLANLLVSWTSKQPRQLAKTAAFFAGANVLLEGFIFAAGRGVSRLEHRELGRSAPETPIVTKGYFAGSPRPLYFTGDAWDEE